MTRIAEVTIHATPAAPIHVDGEPMGTAESITVRVVPGALRVAVPGR
jgi:diacylglycerol kinase family enzyme